MMYYTEAEESPVQEEIFTVKDLNLISRGLLERSFQNIWVKGEISNLSQPRSGHLYFTLKDEYAQIRCAMFRGQQRGISFDLKEGLEVLVQGHVSIYIDRGDYQLIASQIKLWGEGELQKAFVALKQKLHSLGWFDESRKKSLPLFPKHIGIVTSATGDALQDILRILKERYPIAPITVYPTEVQGKTAAPSIVKAIKLAQRHKQADVLILARGGGSMEDLWAFNEEIVAKSIYESTLPIITGIGHEMDFTIADFVADLRAPTPTGAAQKCCPDQKDLILTFAELEKHLLKTLVRFIEWYQVKVDHFEKRLIHPKQKIEHHLERLNHFMRHLQTHMNALLSQKENALAKMAGLLHTLSPLQTLQRGYAIVLDSEQKTIGSISKVQAGQIIQTRLTDGVFKSQVLEVKS